MQEKKSYTDGYQYFVLNVFLKLNAVYDLTFDFAIYTKNICKLNDRWLEQNWLL